MRDGEWVPGGKGWVGCDLRSVWVARFLLVIPKRERVSGRLIGSLGLLWYNSRRVSTRWPDSVFVHAELRWARSSTVQRGCCLSHLACDVPHGCDSRVFSWSSRSPSGCRRCFFGSNQSVSSSERNALTCWGCCDRWDDRLFSPFPSFLIHHPR